MKILYRIRTKRTQKNCPSNVSNLENNISLWAFSSPQSVVEHSHSLTGDMNMPGFCQVVFLIIMQTPHTRDLIYRFPSQCGQTLWLKKEFDCLNKSSLQWAGSAPLALKEREGFYNYLNKINSLFSIKLKKIWIISPPPPSVNSLCQVQHYFLVSELQNNPCFKNNNKLSSPALSLRSGKYPSGQIFSSLLWDAIP